MSYDKVVGIDYNMSVWYQQDHIYGEDDIARFFDNVAACGVDAVYWRTSMIGCVTYRSKVQKLPYEVDWDDYFAHASEKERRRSLMLRLAQAEKVRFILSRYDPPEVAVREARRAGVKIYIWLTCFDDYYPGHHGVFAEDGVCLAEDRTGTRKMRGVLSYAWPEARRRRMSEIAELLDYGADGLYICTKSHSQHTEPAREIDTYGYEAPVAEEFERRCGVDIRRADDFDRDAWHALKGEFFTDFLREVRQAARARGQRLSLGAMFGKYHYFRAPTLGSNHVLRFENQWRTWAEEDLLDELIVGNGQRLWFKDPLWEHPEVPWDADTEQAGFLVDEVYPAQDRRNLKIYLWSGWIHPPSTPEVEQRMQHKLQSMRRACETTSADGMLIHEADAFETADRYDMLAQA